jgi:ketosteroid isomerase-like protein
MMVKKILPLFFIPAFISCFPHSDMSKKITAIHWGIQGNIQDSTLFNKDTLIFKRKEEFTQAQLFLKPDGTVEFHYNIKEIVAKEDDQKNNDTAISTNMYFQNIAVGKWKVLNNNILKINYDYLNLERKYSISFDEPDKRLTLILIKK